ncbi:MAG: hypothetical protein FK730_09905 [Asgard group archaeon]|nr:hypothetical protein [Asgard group archaeon]
MPRKKREKTQAIKKEGNKKEKSKKKKSRKEDIKQQKQEEKTKELQNNIYNILFDELSLFLNELQHVSIKSLKQKLVLIDGKLLWIEKESEEDLLEEEGSEDIIDMEMEMLEMGLDLETAEEMKMEFKPIEAGLGLDDFKAQIEETKTLGEDLKEMLTEMTLDDNPMDDLLFKFILYDLRAILERAINDVFRIEGKIKKLAKEQDSLKKIEVLRIDQKKAVKSSLKDMINKIKKEKPKLILKEEKIKEYKQLTNKQVVDLKAKEEKQFDQLVDELLK